MALQQIYDLVRTTYQGKRYSQISGDGLANKATASITVSLGFVSVALAWAPAVRTNTVTASMLQVCNYKSMTLPSPKLSSRLASISCCVPAFKWSGVTLNLF